MLKAGGESEDAEFVVTAVSEGSATSLMLQEMVADQKSGRFSFADLSQYVAVELERARALEQLPRYFSAMFGSYVVGAAFLAHGDLTTVMTQPDNHSVGEALLTVRRAMPRSSEQLLHPDKYWDSAHRDEPVVIDDRAMSLWVSKPGRHIVHRDTLGELLTAVLTEPRDARRNLMQMQAASAWTNAGATGLGRRSLLPARGPGGRRRAQDHQGAAGRLGDDLGHAQGPGQVPRGPGQRIPAAQFRRRPRRLAIRHRLHRDSRERAGLAPAPIRRAGADDDARRPELDTIGGFRVFKSALVGLAALALATVATTGQTPNPGASRSPDQLESLAAVYAGPHAAVRDTNGDGLNDAVAARVIVPDTPTADDVEAAANIAARLGYETTALTLPLVAARHRGRPRPPRSGCPSSSVARTDSSRRSSSAAPSTSRHSSPARASLRWSPPRSASPPASS